MTKAKVLLALSIAVVLLSALVSPPPAAQGRMTAVGTPRNETLIVYPFGGRTTQPSQQNPLMAYNVWLGMKDLGMGWLWETDTATGKSFPELASENAQGADRRAYEVSDQAAGHRVLERRHQVHR
jgi:hypothetical protein